MLLVIFSEALGAGQTYADRHDYWLDPSQEMIAMGAANIGSGLLGGLACDGSLSQTAVNDGAGAHTQVSTLTASALALVTVIALTPLFTDLPEAVLGALIIHAVSHLMNVGQMRRFYRLAPREFWLGAITLSSVVVFDVLPALLIGVGLSIILLVYRASRPPLSVLGTEPGRPDVFVDIARHPEAHPANGVFVVRPDAPLFYANAQAVQDAIVADITAARPPPRVLIIDLDSNDELDITSLEALAKPHSKLQRGGVTLVLAHLHGPAAARAHLSGFLDAVGPEHVFANVPSALAWATSSPGR